MAVFYGVRHFSPACAYYITEFLDREDPDLVLIEGPADLNGLIGPLCSLDTFLPAAILAYTDKSPIKTVLYPFAEFSPEYRAMKWAADKGAEVRFCDLPSFCVLAMQNNEENGQENSRDECKGESVYTQLERLTGLDNDSFWEYSFEACEEYEDFLAAVEEYGRSLREFSADIEENSLREAYMRRVIHEAEQSGKYGKIAVITGAFHTAAVKEQNFTDDDRLKTDKLPETSSKSTLMPYSYYRLSSVSGYGAGSKAPGYYEIIWKKRLSGRLNEVSAEYLTRLAAYQRENGYAASSAEVIEALRLSETLASMRGGKLANLADLRDSAVTCLGHGSFGEISLACANVEIGTKIGSLPEGTVCTSLQEDFNRELKDLKLERFRTAASMELELDLRENLRVKSEKSAFLDLNRSFFLHRLKILGIHFGEQQTRSQDNATWAEMWKLRWSPETEIEIVEASLIGDTVCQAAELSIGRRLVQADTLIKTGEILSDAFACGLPEAVKTAVSAVQSLAAGCTSAADCGSVIGILSSIVRFGSIRRIDSSPLIPLMQQLFLRFTLELPYSWVCDKLAADALVTGILRVNDACLSHDFLDDERFLDLMHELSDSDMANPYLSGFGCAVLMERGKISPEALSVLISRRLSHGTPAGDGALWFEGLSKKNRRSLIGRLSVWEKLCEYISGLDDEEFKPVLVCLRRTFSEFTPAEKADIGENIGEALGISRENASEFISAVMTAEEEQTLDELDDFDFGDI